MPLTAGLLPGTLDVLIQETESWNRLAQAIALALAATRQEA
jgi:hypothetical protein